MSQVTMTGAPGSGARYLAAVAASALAQLGEAVVWCTTDVAPELSAAVRVVSPAELGLVASAGAWVVLDGVATQVPAGVRVIEVLEA